MNQRILGLSLIFLWGAALQGCGSVPVSTEAKSAPVAEPVVAFSVTPGILAPDLAADRPAAFDAAIAQAPPEFAYCRAKFGQHANALDGCERYAHESYQRLGPAFRRASLDSMAVESKRLEGCMRRHDGLLGVDWILVENCFSRDAR